jgi:hypothetical protein
VVMAVKNSRATAMVFIAAQLGQARLAWQLGASQAGCSAVD